MRIDGYITKGIIHAQESLNITSDELKPDTILKGIVKSLNDGSIEIQLANGKIIEAKNETDTVISVGKCLFLQVVDDSASYIKLKILPNNELDISSKLEILLNRWGLSCTLVNKVTLYSIFIQGIPITLETLKFFLQKQQKLSNRIAILIEKGNEEKYFSIAKELEDSLPDINKIDQFFNDFDYSIRKLYKKAFELNNKLFGNDKNTTTYDKYMNQLLNNSLHNGDGFPFHTVQIPLKIGSRFFHSQIWFDKQDEQFFIEVELNNMGNIGCWINGCKDATSLEFYCQSESVVNYLNKLLPQLKVALCQRGVMVNSISILTDPLRGLSNFLFRYPANFPTLDIRV